MIWPWPALARRALSRVTRRRPGWDDGDRVHATATYTGAVMANRGGFSWKRATGVTRTKQRISRSTGIPLTNSGRQRKVGAMMTGGGCLLPLLTLAGAVLATIH